MLLIDKPSVTQQGETLKEVYYSGTVTVPVMYVWLHSEAAVVIIK